MHGSKALSNLIEDPDLQDSARPETKWSLVKAFDWAATPLGPMAEWPDSLKTTVQDHLAAGQIAAGITSAPAFEGERVPASATANVEEALNWAPRSVAARSAMSDAGDRGAEAAHKPVILLADDNPDMREYVAGVLSTRFRVMTAENGLQALEQMHRVKPDLILSDIAMPEMDGFALLAELRGRPETRTIPVIVLSARAGEEARLEGLESGADDYLIKPFSARELVAHVDAQLKMEGLRREAMEQEAALEQEIHTARQFAWEALEHIPDAFCTMNSEFRVTYLNAAAAAVVARAGKELLGNCLWDLYPSLLGTDVEANFRRAMEQRVPAVFERYFKTEQGEAWYEFHVYPQPAEGLILYLRNTTGKRRAEQALRRSEQLAAAGRLAAGVAHEINNPLEAVTNLLYLAKMDPSVTGETKSVLEYADHELQRLSHIAARSLKFYRQCTAPALSPLEEIVETVLFFNAPDARTRSIQLERRYRPAQPLLCLPGEIQQVITNLVHNALDATREGGRLVAAVRAARDGRGREGVAVTIADTGSGMDRQTMERVFQPFVTTKGDAGTGLGLWVSKGILDNHHARVAVRSKPGRGTVFRMFFPFEAGKPESITAPR